MSSAGSPDRPPIFLRALQRALQAHHRRLGSALQNAAKSTHSGFCTDRPCEATRFIDRLNPSIWDSAFLGVLVAMQNKAADLSQSVIVSLRAVH